MFQYYSFANGTNDNLLKQSGSYDSANSYSDNKGLYGVKNKINITFKNTSSASRLIKVFLTSRVNAFGGACQWNNNPTVGVPKLNLTSSDQEAVQVVSFTLAAGATATPAHHIDRRIAVRSRCSCYTNLGSLNE